MKTFVKLPLLICFILFLISTGCKKNSEKSNTNTDPWAGLRDLGPGEIKFSGENFCYYDCDNDQVFCGERSIMDCDVSKYHQDFFSYDCYVITDFNDTFDNKNYYSYINKKFGSMFFVFFCGRKENSYSGFYTVVTGIYSCSDLYNNSPRYSGTYLQFNGDCGEHNCNPCQANCSGRECGPNGCGGSCGTCPSGSKCSVAGNCISDNTGDPCSACLSTCQGLPECCTGCGCMCESECGGCFK